MSRVVQLYVTDIESKEVRPLKSLRGIKRISLEPSESATVKVMVTPEDLAFFDLVEKQQVVELGMFEIGIGTSSSEMITTQLEVVE